MPPIYLDYNATTPLDPRVFDAMTPWFLEPGNAGSRTHVFGQRAKDVVEQARQEVGKLLGVQTEDIYFTSGATESNNIVILGLAHYGIETGRRHVVSTAIEHKAVLEPLHQLTQLGFEVELAPITKGGFVDPDTIRAKLRPDTLLVSVMHGNNETGILQPLEDISEMTSKAGVLLHTDGAQTFGKKVNSLRNAECDFVSISGHKIFGPKGIGAIFVRREPGKKRILQSLLFGGGQERGLRPGTLPVPLIVGLGKAAELAGTEFKAREEAAQKVKSRLIDELDEVEHQIHGDQSRCMSHVLNVSFPGVDSEALMMATRNEIAISNGSACTSATYTPSHVLKAMGVSDDLIESAVRISWGPPIERVPADVIKNALLRLKIYA